MQDPYPFVEEDPTTNLRDADRYIYASMAYMYSSGISDIKEAIEILEGLTQTDRISIP